MVSILIGSLNKNELIILNSLSLLFFFIIILLFNIISGLFAGNPFIQKPTLKDYSPCPPASITNPYLPPLPTKYVEPSPDFDPSSAALSSSNGQFYLSLKGVRKTLIRLTGTKREGGRIEELLSIIEDEIVSWLEFPARNHRTYGSRTIDSTPVASTSTVSYELGDLPTSTSRPAQPSTSPSITEFTHTPSKLLWHIPDPHTRYLAHVLARYYNLPSYSTSASELPPSHSAHSFDPTERVTHFIRPAFIRPDQGQVGNLMSPPATDMSASGTEGGITTAGESSGAETDSESGIGEGSTRGESEWDEVVREWVEVEDLDLGDTEEESEVGSNYDRDGEGTGTDDEASSTGTGGGFDSMESSLAELPPRTPNANQDQFVREGSATPRVIPRSSFGGRRRSGLGYGGESSPSRSPERVEVRREAIKQQRQEWYYPEKTFLEFLFG